MADDFSPSNLSKDQIAVLADHFAQKNEYRPGDDIRAFVQKIGGTIDYTNSAADSFGGSLDVKGGKISIHLSRFTNPARDNFTIAHELGHYVLHSRCGKLDIHAGRTDSRNKCEAEANYFAACFLMPEEAFRTSHKKDSNIYSLADAFNVSLSAVQIRCQSLNLPL